MPNIELSGYSFDAIVFDCDGTLVDSAPLHFNAFKTALARQGALLDRKWYRARLGLSRHGLLAEFSNDETRTIDVPRAVAESEAHFLISTVELKEIPVVAEIARRYFGQVPMAVASSGQRLSVYESLKSVGMFDLFDPILTADDVSVCKPDPEIYIRAAERMQMDVSRCLVFEDSDEGVKAASLAGSQVIDVRAYL